MDLYITVILRSVGDMREDINFKGADMELDF